MNLRNDHATQLSLPSDREIRIVRDFKAPKRFVFEAWSKPEHVQRWYGCVGMALVACDMDFREGGKWRWVLRNSSDGTDHGCSGEYREIVRPDRLVFTELYEPVPGSDHVVTLGFEERGGITTLTQTLLHASRQNRDGHLQSGMENGLEATFAHLEEVARSLAAPSMARSA